jgi:uncharacterized protein with WD repeat
MCSETESVFPSGSLSQAILSPFGAVQFVRYGFFKQDDLGIWTAPNGDKIAWFKDPDGNTLSVSEHI